MTTTTTGPSAVEAPGVLEVPAVPEPAVQPPAPAARTVRSSIRAMAIVLWVVVGSLLTYGIVMTVFKAAALFG